jgi:LAS superfamily LD-carboxypeptidase LdcB
MSKYYSSKNISVAISTVLIIAISVFLGYACNLYSTTAKRLAGAEKELSSLLGSYIELQNKNLELEKQSALLSERLAITEGDKASLSETLEDEKNKNDVFASQISAITNTVGTLDKLSKTDKELLQKYSKVYFLNENYIPQDLTLVDQSYLLDKEKKMSFHTKAYPFLSRMMEAAAATGTPLAIVSAYRSFGEQAVLKANYTVNYGSGANRFSADQGYSEHQLGTAIDLASPSQGGLSMSFDKTPQGKWLLENAYKYGFIISYPKENTYYQYEPWHWRFVGTTLATQIHNTNETFYGMIQRNIDSYLISIFD